ncbi:MAG: ABC transporter permease subunit, partial [Cytophagia bacterium]|nr:ABC transporter permease subunit [Cytophagia bacterium]
VAFSPNNAIGNWLQNTVAIQLIFSFPGLVLASMIYSLPFMVQPIQAGLSGLSSNMKESSYVLGKSRFTTLLKVLMPNIKPSILTALVLSFAHTMGEFGVVLMIGGNIPGVTKVASIAIYDEVESLNYAAAHQYALILLLLTFGILVTVYSLNKKISLTGNHA